METFVPQTSLRGGRIWTWRGRSSLRRNLDQRAPPSWRSACSLPNLKWSLRNIAPNKHASHGISCSSFIYYFQTSRKGSCLSFVHKKEEILQLFLQILHLIYLRSAKCADQSVYVNIRGKVKQTCQRWEKPAITNLPLVYTSPDDQSFNCLVLWNLSYLFIFLSPIIGVLSSPFRFSQIWWGRSQTTSSRPLGIFGDLNLSSKNCSPLPWHSFLITL